MDPIASRPRFGPEYGVPTSEEGLLPWSHVRERMEGAQHYWISTVGPGGAPHPRPIDGMWLDDRLYFGGSPQSRWWRNLATNASASIHLEDAESAVILDGSVRILRPDRALAERLVSASNAKYALGQKLDDYEGAEVAEFSPHRAFAWTVLYRDATRWQIF